MAVTYASMRRAVAIRAGDWWTGTLPATHAAGVLQIDDPNRREAAGFFRNAFLRLGHDRIISTPSTRYTPEDLRIVESRPASFDLAFANEYEHLTDMTYEIHRLTDVPTYNSFIAAAIEDAGAEAVVAEYKDVSTAITANANKPGGVEDEYAVPTGLRYITEVRVADANGEYTHTIPLRLIKPMPGSTKMIRFDLMSISGFPAGRLIRISGQGLASSTAQYDDTTIPIDPSFVREYLYNELLMLQSRRSGQLGDFARQRLPAQQQLVELKRMTMQTEYRAEPGVVVVPN